MCNFFIFFYGLEIIYDPSAQSHLTAREINYSLCLIFIFKMVGMNSVYDILFGQYESIKKRFIEKGTFGCV